MIWLYRLRNLPMLIVLHAKHSAQFVRVQTAQLLLFNACEEGGAEQETIDIRTSELELHLEKLADIDERMMKLWQRR